MLAIPKQSACTRPSYTITTIKRKSEWIHPRTCLEYANIALRSEGRQIMLTATSMQKFRI